MPANRPAPECGLFRHPFSRAYWRQAASEMRSTKMLVFAALMVALRVALKSLTVQIAPSLQISFGFFVNALGSMVYGPVVALLGGAVSDTLGCVLFPTGPYFFPFILIEMASSLVFALWLYRVEITTLRVVLSRFCIDFFVNIVLQTPVMCLYYKMVLGKSYTVFNLPRIIKNLVLFPIESVLLVLFLQAVIPAVKPLGFLRSGTERLKLTKENLITLAALAVIGVSAVGVWLALR
ncbi:MAG: folate family ECF transporter S component [Clostridia bacterium]|nr:folate family ECF transporter S component [Clostridia bacterium]